MATQLWAILLVITAAVTGSLAPILIKKASKDVTWKVAAITNKYLIGGISLYVLGTALFIPALKGGELSVLYPLVSVTYIFVAFWSVKILHEKMNTLKWLGIALIIMGVTLIGLGS